jgi:hypothetical protein
MAVVFISPKQRQRTFFMLIIVVFLLILTGISLGVFLSQPPEVSPVLVFNKQKIDVNTEIFELEQFKNLRPVVQMELQYSYTAVGRDKKLKTGFVSAVSLDKAREILQAQGLSVSKIELVSAGRENPFVPYY